MQTLEEQVYQLIKQYHITLSTAESATGGMIASRLIHVPGISEFFEQGYVTYSNEAKVKMIGVSRELIDTYGVVSKEVADNMAQCAARTAGTDAALSVTGIAGPDGGTTDCPVGTVYIGCYLKNQTLVEHHVFEGNRTEVRKKATNRALTLLIEQIKNNITRQKL